MQKRRAVILFADLKGSGDFAATQTPERYNEVVRAFQQTGQQVIQDYRRAEGLGDDRVLAGGMGDQCHLVLVGGPPYEDERHALSIATRLNTAWHDSPTGKNLAAFGESPFGTLVELALAIGCGDVVLDEDVWTGQQTAEGMALGEIQRLQHLAGEVVARACILVTLEVKEAAERFGLPIVFGDRIQSNAQPVSTPVPSIPVYPVMSWNEG